jgi:hypothetical protein
MVLTSAAQLRQLSEAEIRAGAPVRVEGILTYYDRHSGYCFVEESTGGMRALLAHGQTPPQTGWRVQISGLAGSGGASPSIIEGRLSATWQATPQPAVTLSAKQMRDPQYEYRRVAVQGIVRSVSSERPGLVTLEIRTQNLTVWAKVPDSPVEVNDDLVDAEVRIPGVLAEGLDGSTSAAGPTLWVASATAIAVPRPAMRAAELPTSRIRNLTSSDPAKLPEHRVRVHGVPFWKPGADLTVMDESGQISIRMVGNSGSPGTKALDVAGFLVWERGHPILDRATQVHPRSVDAPSRGSTLTTAIQVRQMPAMAARLAYPVHLRAVVTYFDSRNGLLFVQDRTDGIFVERTGEQHLPPKPGDAVEVTGVTGADFAPNVDKADVKVVGHPGLPEPSTRSLGVALRGSEDSRWVELRGIVRHVAEGEGDSLVTLVWGQEMYKAHILADSRYLASLVDAEVQVKGVCGSLFNGKRQLLGIQLFVPGKEYLQVTREPPGDPFSMAPASVEDLLRFSRAHDPGHRVRVRGVVTYGNRDGST